MNYVAWDVPIIGSGWVIGIIAIFHVMISHFAIGGGFYLPMAEAKAIKEGREDWMQIIRGHAKFFLILTAVFGTVSGVGIWFAIGLAQPEGTSTLIHNFVFGWAIEWVFFMVEISAAAAYYYTWGRVDHKTHLRLGWVYAISAWASLVIINGILTFMLTPGATWLSVAGTGNEASKFWNAFFNPTYWPSLILRTLVCLALAGVWALVTASRIDGFTQPKLKTEVIRWSIKWMLPAFLLMPFAFGWYVWMIPVSQKGLLDLGVSTIGQGTFTQVTRSALVIVMTSATILAVAYAFGWRNPRDFTFGHACAILVLALAATASTEQAREMLRKPFVIGEHMYSNGIRKSDVKRFNEQGFLTGSPWLPAEDKVVLASTEGPSPEVQLRAGELMFRGQCMACHTRDGYRSMQQFLSGRDKASITNIVTMLHDYPEDSPYRRYMPPLVGSPAEVNSLIAYLDQLANPPKTEAPAAAQVALH